MFVGNSYLTSAKSILSKLLVVIILTLFGSLAYSLTPPSGSNKNFLGEPANSSEFGKVFMVSLGGKVYDNIWKMTDIKEPRVRNPAYPRGKEVPVLGTWRCVSCHGWDYKGATRKEGRDADKAVFTSLRHLQGTDPRAIVAKIMGGSHRYPKQVLPDFVAEILALFLSVGQYDRAALFNKEKRLECVLFTLKRTHLPMVLKVWRFMLCL